MMGHAKESVRQHRRAVTEYVVTDTVIVVNPLTGGAHYNSPAFFAAAS